MAEQKGYRMYSKDISKKLYEIHSKNGDNASAFKYSQLLLKLYDEQINQERLLEIDYIEYAVKDQQLISQQKESLYNLRMLWLAIAVCILTILSIIFLCRNWKLTRETNEILRLQFSQLESTTESLEKSNQNYAKLIKMVAHDLLNPIGGIRALCQLLLVEDLTPDETSSCLNIISDLLRNDFDLKESELRKEDISLPAFLQQAITLLNFPYCRSADLSRQTKSAFADEEQMVYFGTAGTFAGLIRKRRYSKFLIQNSNT